MLAAANVVPAHSAGLPAKAKTGALGKVVGELPPGRYDSHMHVYTPAAPRPEEFKAELEGNGFAGGCLFSTCPYCGAGNKPPAFRRPEQAMDNVIAWASASPTIYPFYWIDPGAPDALDLVDMAVEKGMYGFKVIRSDGLPCDDKTMPVYEKIAATGRPLTFHTGILYDGKASSMYFRPVSFEPLVGIKDLRFVLAHVSWPWHDECLAVYGKMKAAAAVSPDTTPKMFIDTTPGTPELYRREVLTKLFKIYDVKDRVLFGTDGHVMGYMGNHDNAYFDMDDPILKAIGMGEAQVDSYYRKALQSYLFGV
jgi:hypothetical protein